MQGHAFPAAFPDRQPAEEKADETQLLPALRSDDTAALSGLPVDDKETQPPTRYNQNTLIDTMQNA